MKRDRKAKIIATLGPSTSNYEEIKSLFIAGADVFRLNFSHGTHEDHLARYNIIRQLEEDMGRPIGVLADLQGPKLRVWDFKDGRIMLSPGQEFRLDLSTELGDETRVNLPHPEIFAAMKKGAILLLDDGRLQLEVEDHSADYAVTRVIYGGVLSNHKGVNIPNVVLPISALTSKDLIDLEFAVDMGVDWIALSFVQRPEDVQKVRRLIAQQVGQRVRLLSKLEKPSAIEHLEEIVNLSDAIMVARGDLGVECPPETVPILQKRIVRACRAHGKPVVVATQMLDSMMFAPTPTRAEASDVATAIYDGVDAVMLSAETATGKYPNDSVTMMDRIITQVENDEHYVSIMEAGCVEESEATIRDAVSAAARQVAHTLHAVAVVTFTSSGSTTLRAARERPEQPIISVTSNIETARQLSLTWGAHNVLTADVRNLAEIAQKACSIAIEEGFAKPGSMLVITAGVPFGCSGVTNVLRVIEIDANGDPS